MYILKFSIDVWVRGHSCRHKYIFGCVWRTQGPIIGTDLVRVQIPSSWIPSWRIHHMSLKYQLTDGGLLKSIFIRPGEIFRIYFFIHFIVEVYTNETETETWILDGWTRFRVICTCPNPSAPTPPCTHKPERKGIH